MTTTHDLPTVVGWWQGRDIAWRRRLDRFPDAATAEAEEAGRGRDRTALWQAMCRSGAASGEMPGAEAAERVVDAAIGHVGAAASALALLPVEDACALGEQPNLPGTVTELLVENGTVVRKGQPLFRIRPDEVFVEEDPAERERRLRASTDAYLARLG